MNSLDLLILIVLLLLIIRGAIRGALQEIFLFLGTLGGIYVASKYKTLFIHYFSFLATRSFIIPILIFILVFSLVIIMGIGVRKMVKVFALSILDRSLGLIVGFLEGIIALGAIFHFIQLTPWGKTWVPTGILLPFILKIFKVIIYPFFPIKS